jgi:hypothetical protein
MLPLCGVPENSEAAKEEDRHDAAAAHAGR